MPGRVLIIDTVATNRIVLKVKMLSAQFIVDACANLDEAAPIIRDNPPDLILINLADQIENRHGFCRKLKDDPATSCISIIAVGIAETSRARLAALDAGADDVMPRPLNDALLLARIRSLMRAGNTGHDMMWRDGMSRTLGFEEPTTPFVAVAAVRVLSDNGTLSADLVKSLQQGIQMPVQRLEPASALKQTATAQPADLLVIDASQPGTILTDLRDLVANLRSRAETRASAQLVVVPPGRPDLAAMMLDVGADDTFSADRTATELSRRARALITRKVRQDQLREFVRTGLQAAITDPLTGLHNRRYIDTHLARLAAQSAEQGVELAIMMVDIDHFKVVNDTYGHAAGDSVLKQVAARMRENMRGIDLLARIGGEEFLVAMPNSTESQASHAANRLRRLVNSRPFDLGPGLPSLRITVSVGVAVSGVIDLPEPCEQSLPRRAQKGVDTMRQEADAALYKAKSAGRDQVALSRSAA